ncbi:MAG: TylF/MycF/NovP-related O-methyltransferase [Chlamydiota bacterium]
MDNYFIKDIYEKNRSMLSFEGALNLHYLLAQTLLLDVAGDVVEVGCYRGLTAILIQKTLEAYVSSKRLHVYDSFDGLPNKTVEDLVESAEHPEFPPTHNEVGGSIPRS